MKQTNFQLFDFLDFDTALTGEDVLWKTCAPVAIQVDGTDVVLEIPFQKQQVANDISPDKETARKNYFFRMRAYGAKILRVSIGFDAPAMPDSLMLEMDKKLTIVQLQVEKTDEEWLVKDASEVIRAKLNRRPLVLDHWSDLLPVPQETLELSFFPDGKKEIKLSAYDQFFPARHDAFALAFVERNGEPDRTTMSFHIEPDEKFVGTGERFTKMDLSGHTFQLKNQDGQGVNNRRTYKNIPFFLSSRMYGVFMHTTAHSKFSLADHSARSAQLLTEEPAMDVFLIGGQTPEEILYSYRCLTGFPTELPLWSFGTWMSRMSYFSADEVNGICKRLRDEDYPCDVIHLDTGWFITDWLCEWKFNPERFPDPKQFIQELRNDGFKVSLWQMPYIAAQAAQYDEALENKYMCILKKVEKQGGSNFSALDYAGTIDFTSPEAVEWYKNLLRNLLEMGVVCIKTDFGEDIHMDAEYHAMKPELLNNLYALLYQKAAFEVTKEVTGDGIVWARAGWAGCQRYPLHWGGDSACSWDGMAGSLKGGLHIGLSGFGYWSHDVPGFHSVPNFMNSVVPDDLYVRWTQFGVFSSHLRYHGTSKREPYEYPSISGIVRKWLKLRYALIPYIMEQSKKVTTSGYPMLRALIFHHPEDNMCWHIDDQYYFGDDFLVAPVMNSENRRDVYLPDGKWVNLFSGKITEGNRWLNGFKCPLDEMPVWVKYGSEIPVYPHPVSNTDEMDLTKAVKIKFDENYKPLLTSPEERNYVPSDYYKRQINTLKNMNTTDKTRMQGSPPLEGLGEAVSWKENLEESKKHYTDWWQGKGIVLSMWEHLQKDGAPYELIAPPIPARDLKQYWFDPQWRAENLHYQLSRSSFKADIMPIANTHLGPGSLAAMMGAELDGGEDTIWIKHVEGKELNLTFNENDPAWKLHRDLLKACKANAQGKYYVGCPDLVEGLDVLASIRGTSETMMDMIMDPEGLAEQLQKVNDVYFQAFDRIYDIIREGDEMTFCYFSLWAPGKVSKLQCDLSIMISEDDFRQFVQPYIREQAQKIDYTLYHLDGVDAQRHLEAILEIKELNAIQWTPGVGEPQGGDPRWYDLYRRILSGGKSVMANWVTLDELEPLLDHVGNQGLHINVDFKSEKDIEAALKIVQKYR